MTLLPSHPPPGRRTLLYLGAALAVYLAMLLITLPALQTAAGGLIPFDMRPTGYSPADAAALLEALGPAGRATYLTRQLPLDTLYPALFALAFSHALAWLGHRAGVAARPLRGLALVPVAAALADYAENALVAAMLLRFPDLPAGLAATASAATLAKSGLTTAVFALLGLFALLWALRAARG